MAASVAPRPILPAMPGSNPPAARTKAHGTGCEQAFGEFLVALDVAFRHDPLDPVLLVLSSLQREPGGAQHRSLAARSRSRPAGATRRFE